MPDAITIRGVTKTFGSKTAVRNLDLTIAQGSLCGFIGPNGAGKTTTIRMVMSIFFPDQGEIRVLGKASALDSKDRIGYLPEERGVYRKMKVGAFLNYVARLKGMDAGATDAKVKAWLERVGLRDTYKKKCEELSKGMQQKVQFISAVIHEPDLIILDEVFSGLDPVNRRLMRDLIHEQHEQGRTIIFSTHAMFEAEALCDHIFMIHQGNKVLDGSLRDIVARFDPNAVLIEPLNPADADRLASVPGLREVREADPGTVGRGVLEARLADDVSPPEAMARIASAVPVRRLEVKRVSLEDVFIDLVVGQQGASGADRETLRQQLATAGQEASS
jgi:ABC-2 type transport system ATP-binding protein